MTEAREVLCAAGPATGGILALAGLNWLAAPGKYPAWAGLSAFVLVAFVTALCLASNFGRRPVEERRAIYGALMCAACTIGLVLLVALLKSLALADGMIAKRTAGTLIGAVLVFCGDQLPKHPSPPGGCRLKLVRVQAAERFVGRILTAGGLFFIVTWLFLPVVVAPKTSAAIGLFAFLAAILAACTVWLPGRVRIR